MRYRSAIRANIEPALGRIDIAKLEPAQIDAFYGKLLASGLSPLSVRKSHAILSAAFAQALRWDWVDRNPLLRASPPTTPAVRSTLRLRPSWASSSKLAQSNIPCSQA